jgi:hypothetical protein
LERRAIEDALVVLPNREAASVDDGGRVTGDINVDSPAEPYPPPIDVRGRARSKTADA